MAGRQGRCIKCGAEFTVPGEAGAHKERRVREIDLEDKPQTPQYIAVECRVCQTRMYGRPHQVGQKLKCPDCGALTEVPPPPPPKRKNIPAALEGEQYELWEADEQPLPSQLIATQPRFIAVKCRQCDTLMYATEDRVGQTIACPDCGTKHKVPPPFAAKPTRSVMAPDAQTPKLDPAAAPGERPAFSPVFSIEMLHDRERETEIAATRELERRTGKKILDAHGRPIMPPVPLITGSLRMILTEEIIARWIMLSLVLGFAGQFLAEALFTPIQGMAEAIKLIFTFLGGALILTWFAMAAPLIVAIVGESSDGEDKLNQPPRLLAFDWFGELFSVFMAGSIAGLCGAGAWQMSRLMQLEFTISTVISTIVVLVLFPMALLSTLLEGTPLGVFSPRLATSFARCPGAWLLFYIETFALAALVGGAALAIANALHLRPGDETTFIWFVGPIAIAALLIDMRLLGRLAWWISERIPEEEEVDDS
jgi:DNA-directed RNA polymerase subunit M/transcription elongation factor TFIIS